MKKMMKKMMNKMNIAECLYGDLTGLLIKIAKSFVKFLKCNYMPLLYWSGCVFSGNAWKMGPDILPNAKAMWYYVITQSMSGGSILSSLVILILISKKNVSSKAMMLAILFINVVAFTGSILEYFNVNILSQTDGIKDIIVEHILFFTIFTVGYLFYVFKDMKNDVETHSDSDSRSDSISNIKIRYLSKKR